MRRYPHPTIHPPRGSLPILLSIPHAGRDYDRDVLANAAQGRRALETLEDPLVDRLCWRAIASGLGAVVQNVPRAAIDCNREESEVDPSSVLGIGPAPVGPRARFGLGLVLRGPIGTARCGAARSTEPNCSGGSMRCIGHIILRWPRRWRRSPGAPGSPY